VLFIACAFNELFYLSLYMMHYHKAPIILSGFSIWTLAALMTAPIWAFKQFMNVVQLVEASQSLVNLEKSPSIAKKR